MFECYIQSTEIKLKTAGKELPSFLVNPAEVDVLKGGRNKND